MIINTAESDMSRYFPQMEPFNGNPREGQLEAAQEIYNKLTSGRSKFFVLAAPTGAGKSAILYTVARAINKAEGHRHLQNAGTIFTTSQKVLQDQYERDFGNDIFVMKGRSNYKCFSPQQDAETPTCDNGKCQVQREKPDCYSLCPYKIAKEKAKLSPIVITNLAYFIGESNNINAFGKRRLLVIDEAHTLENGLMSYVECSISKFILKFCKLERTIPFFDQFYKYEDFLTRLKDDAIKSIEKIEKEINNNPSQVFSDLFKRMERLKNLVSKIQFMMFHKDRCKWIVDIDKEKVRVAFKPINVAAFAKSLVFSFADIVVMTSATISPSYVENCLGIPIEDFEYLEMPSNFPIENRPIVPMNIGKMSYKYIDGTLPKIVDVVDSLIEKHAGEKGIIHATSYKIARYIHDGTSFRDRIITHNTKDRMEKLQEHIESDSDSILLSPSMAEGVDLKGDLSRFQIVVKIPYPSLADPQIKARMYIDKVWYANQAAVTIMQAYGRSIRSKDDVAITYILDSGFPYFIKTHQGLFCDWFINAVVKKSYA